MNRLQFFIGIVPPHEYKEQIIQFQNRWSNNHISDVVEPHITVKAQSGLSPNLEWMGKIKESCSTFSRFQLSLSEPASFGITVVYISVQSKEIVELHRRLVEVISPSLELIERYFELGNYTPHLTLGQTHWGMKEEELAEMNTIARNDLAPFPTWTVTHLRVYKEIKPDKYVPFEDIPLA
ncbi:MAG: 2'-5' RNA ligase family protein [Bacillota bacterium]